MWEGLARETCEQEDGYNLVKQLKPKIKNDLLTWVMDYATGDDRTVDALARRIINVNIGAVLPGTYVSRYAFSLFFLLMAEITSPRRSLMRFSILRRDRSTLSLSAKKSSKSCRLKDGRRPQSQRCESSTVSSRSRCGTVASTRVSVQYSDLT